jgi:hypothetical protein
MIIGPKIDPILMTDCKPPRTHRRGKRTKELPGLAGIRIHGEEKKRSFVLTTGEVNCVHPSCFSRTQKIPPDDGLSHRYAEVPLGDCIFKERT